MNLVKTIVSAILAVLLTGVAYAQNVTYGSISGKVISEDGTAVGYAAVVLYPSETFTLTDAKGAYRFQNVTAGDVKIVVEFIGMEKSEKTVKVVGGKETIINFTLKEQSFRLDEVTVTATGSAAGSSTSSTISRQALDHLQTSSIKDALALLPGVALSNPNLNSAQTITLRTNASSNSGSYSMNSLGTAIIVDGAPMSNNANLQSLSTAVNAGNLNVGTVGGSSPQDGFDLRALSTDNIESIEVIRGIPSAEYGDMTSGAVIVKSKAGKMPLSVRFKTNPNIYQVSAGQGFRTGRAGDLNLSADYAYSTNSLTASYIYYQRLNLKALLTKTLWQRLNTNTSIQLGYRKDTRDQNPDDARSSLATGARNVDIRFSSYGQLQADKGIFKSISYSLSGTWADKHNFYESEVTNAQSIYSTSMGNSTVTNWKGESMNDASGNPITSFAPGDENAYVTVMPYAYFSHYDIYGKEINVYAKAVANFYQKIGKSIDSRGILGVDYKMDGNLGDGLVFPEGTPPGRIPSNASSGYRQLAYKDIPFVHQIGLFAEEKWQQKIARRQFNVTAGVRYDMIGGLTALAPRVNASFEIIPSVLTVRGGWGITAKAPTSIYLHPQNAYYDAINYSNMFQGLDRSEELVVGTTKVFPTVNPDLKIAKNRKAEIGMDLKIAGRYRVEITGYDELMKNGYTFAHDMDSFVWTPYQTYMQTGMSGGHPVIAPDKLYNIFFAFSRPQNYVWMHNRGLEYEIDLGRFDAIRTSFNINGAWSYTKTSSNGYTFSTRANGGAIEYNVGVYEPFMSSSCYEKVLTTFRATHNIPAIGFVVTLTAQADWYGKMWNEFGNDEMFVKYISRKDGKVYDFDPAKKTDPEFSYMFEPLSEKRFLPETTKPYVIFNINITKEIGNFLTASFYVNNLFNARPLDESDITKGNFTELGIPMFFGMELNIKFNHKTNKR